MNLGLTTPLLSLLGFAAWTALLVLAVAVWRTRMVLGGEIAANAFPHGDRHGSDRYWRLNRAHLNAAENLPLFAAVVLVGSVAGVATPLFSTLSQVYLGARVAQSAIHVSSNHVVAVNLRFAALLTQLGCFLWMSAEILRAAG